MIVMALSISILINIVLLIQNAILRGSRDRANEIIENVKEKLML